MTTYTRKQLENQLKNCMLALMVWKQDVSPRSVDLDNWTCGTQACFGGHLAKWPEFPQVTESCGVPYLGRDVAGKDVAERLFGAYGMFSGKGCSEFDYELIKPNTSHHKTVVNRLERRIDQIADLL